MNPLQRFRGTDAARLDDLAARALTASQAVTRSAAIIRAASGGSPSPTDPALDDLRTWLDRVAADARRRAELTRQGASPAPPPAPPTPAPPPAPLAPPRLVSRHHTDPELRRDGASGWHLQGYLGPGLSWRHIGTEHRTTTSVFDHGRGWTVQVVTDEHRAVYDVELGAGFGPKRFGGLGPSRRHDSWQEGSTHRVYLHDSQRVSRRQFEAAAGPEVADGE